MWQFAEAVRGLADGCRELGTPVTGGNVSFYNQTGTSAILPTPVVGVLGVIDDVHHRTRQAFRTDGAKIFLLGTSRDEFGGSEWAHVLHGFLGGKPPTVDFAAERALAELLIDAAADGILDSAHDLAEGGLAQGLAECCLPGQAGARITLPAGVDPFVALFSESTARAVISVTREHEQEFVARCAEQGVPLTPLGVVDILEISLVVTAQFAIPVRELRKAWSALLPARFDR
jgi:phosphoribosylformylglycinamidine synthase subunit PurL